MKAILSVLFTFFSLVSIAQISADSGKIEQTRIVSISRFQTIDYFASAREQKLPARKGDLIVLQDEERRLYYGIVDTVRSLNSIRIVLYPKANQRELVEAAYDDLYYLKAGNSKVETVLQKKEPEPDYVEELARKDQQIKQQDLKINQAAIYLENAGQDYETGDILRYVSQASFVLGTAFTSIGSLSSGSTLQTAGGILIGSSLVTGISSIVYRFRGHNKLKTAGATLRR
jgi:hypothetical protein